MMTFGDLLEKKRDTIIGRWEDEVLSAYPPDSAALFRAQQDPFANPLGHSVREGTRGIFLAILSGMDQDDLRRHLDQILRVRAVQELTPSQALSFIFSLRSIVREVLPEAERDPDHHEGLRAFDQKVDGVALEAFELYTARREELSQLRINEVKRQVTWTFERMNRKRDSAKSVPDDLKPTTSAHDRVQGEDL
jgi:hypothetical protein